jgi:predicted Zn-dependent protease with MMP-like domain
MTIKYFEQLVGEAIEELPENIRKMIKNVAILTETLPSEEQLEKVGVRQGIFLLGLYEGVPETAWGKGFGSHLPDKITIFKESIENFAKTQEEIKSMIKSVVWHEIAHHFGIDEKEVRKLESKWNAK